MPDRSELRVFSEGGEPTPPYGHPSWEGIYMSEIIDRVIWIYALLVDFSFFLILTAAVPPIKEPIIEKGSGTDVAAAGEILNAVN